MKHLSYVDVDAKILHFATTIVNRDAIFLSIKDKSFFAEAAFPAWPQVTTVLSFPVATRRVTGVAACLVFRIFTFTLHCFTLEYKIDETHAVDSLTTEGGGSPCNLQVILVCANFRH